MELKQISVILFYVMFVYSGYTKIINFNNKVSTLQLKTKLPYIINVGGMIGVIILEIIGSLIIITHYLKKDLIPLWVVKFVKNIYLLFLVVVTLLYHPPGKKIIPFLSNLTTFSGMLYMAGDL
jgi:hypothetical protein